MRHKPGSLIYRDTKALSLEKGRRVGEPGHEEAKQYLLQRMSEIKLQPFSGNSFELAFNHESEIMGSQSFCNLVGKIPGTDPGQRSPYLIGAHYDTVIDAPCSDDNAASVAVVLAAAEYFAEHPQKADIIIAFFDSEEPPWFLSPAMGSIRFYEDYCRQISFKAVIILDLIGHKMEIPGYPFLSKVPRLRYLLFALGSESGSSIADALERAARLVRQLHVLPTLNSYLGDLSDHRAFRLGGEPYIFLSGGQGKYYHDSRDNLEWIDFSRVRKVFKLVIEIIKSSEFQKNKKGIKDRDHADFEIRMIKKSLGWFYHPVLRYLKVKSLKNREDIDKLATALSPSFSSGLIFLDDGEM